MIFLSVKSLKKIIFFFDYLRNSNDPREPICACVSCQLTVPISIAMPFIFHCDRDCLGNLFAIPLTNQASGMSMPAEIPDDVINLPSFTQRAWRIQLTRGPCDTGHSTNLLIGSRAPSVQQSCSGEQPRSRTYGHHQIRLSTAAAQGIN